MAERTAVALQKQLERELQHKLWLSNHMSGSLQQRQSLRRILELRTKLALMLAKHITR